MKVTVCFTVSYLPLRSANQIIPELNIQLTISFSVTIIYRDFYSKYVSFLVTDATVTSYRYFAMEEWRICT